jgi:hypothetical protein
LPTFQLQNNIIGRKICPFLEKTHDELKTETIGNRIHVKSKFGVVLDRVELISVAPDLTDAEWVNLYRQIGRTVKGGRVWPPRRSFDRHETLVIKVQLLKTRGVYVLFDPVDYGMVEIAAKLAKKKNSDFIRQAVMYAVDREYNREAMRKQRESQLRQQATEQRETKYVT